MNENPRHTISRALDEHCDQLHPEQARRIIAALDAAGYVVVPKEPTRAMWAAGADATLGKALVHHDKIVGDVWPAMISASRENA